MTIGHLASLFCSGAEGSDGGCGPLEQTEAKCMFCSPSADGGDWLGCEMKRLISVGENVRGLLSCALGLSIKPSEHLNGVQTTPSSDFHIQV